MGWSGDPGGPTGSISAAWGGRDRGTRPGAEQAAGASPGGHPASPASPSPAAARPPAVRPPSPHRRGPRCPPRGFPGARRPQPPARPRCSAGPEEGAPRPPLPAPRRAAPSRARQQNSRGGCRGVGLNAGGRPQQELFHPNPTQQEQGGKGNGGEQKRLPSKEQLHSHAAHGRCGCRSSHGQTRPKITEEKSLEGY